MPYLLGHYPEEGLVLVDLDDTGITSLPPSVSTSGGTKMVADELFDAVQVAQPLHDAPDGQAAHFGVALQIVAVFDPI